MESLNLWPELPYNEFKSTGYLLHMTAQAMGKCKLLTPFEPHWANVALWVTTRGVTTGPIPYAKGIFSIDLDILHNRITVMTDYGDEASINLQSISVADLTAHLFEKIRSFGIQLSINPMPQEIVNPIAFHEDTNLREYRHDLARNWYQILVSSYNVIQKYHARFTGRTPAVGLMWGTFDLRDARYINKKVSTDIGFTDYIRRNAMDVAQVEVGWWSGTDEYPRAAYFSFLYPEPPGIANVKPEPSTARWDEKLKEFILDYDALREFEQPEKELLSFFESTYQAEAKMAGWDADLVGKGVPV